MTEQLKEQYLSNAAKIKQEIIEAPENNAYKESGWEPIFMVSPEAKILIVGPAPGRETQQKGIPFCDKSGARLREWLGVTDTTFYESGKFAVLPLDFYYPGKAKTGDLPPRKGFAEKWHAPLLDCMPEVQLILLLGGDAQKFYLKDSKKRTVTETVFSFAEYLPTYFPLIHPSPLNFRWHAKHPKFEREIIPILKKQVNGIIHINE